MLMSRRLFSASNDEDETYQGAAYLTARVPRIRCPECGIVKLKSFPWARRESGFTLLFEAMIMAMARPMRVNAIAAIVGEHDTRLWRIIHYYVDQARQQEYSGPRISDSGLSW
jgi:transposase